MDVNYIGSTNKTIIIKPGCNKQIQIWKNSSKIIEFTLKEFLSIFSDLKVAEAVTEHMAYPTYRLSTNIINHHEIQYLLREGKPFIRIVHLVDFNKSDCTDGAFFGATAWKCFVSMTDKILKLCCPPRAFRDMRQVERDCPVSKINKSPKVVLSKGV